MVTVGMNYQVLDGKGPEFESVFKKVVQIMRGMDGHVDTHLYHEVEQPNAYIILSEWSERRAFDAFIQSTQFRNVVDWGKANILAARPKHQVYGNEPDAPAKCPVGAH